MNLDIAKHELNEVNLIINRITSELLQFPTLYEIVNSLVDKLDYWLTIKDKLEEIIAEKELLQQQEKYNQEVIELMESETMKNQEKPKAHICINYMSKHDIYIIYVRVGKVHSNKQFWYNEVKPYDLINLDRIRSTMKHKLNDTGLFEIIDLTLDTERTWIKYNLRNGGEIPDYYKV